MKFIGITGGVGAGKSTVLAYLKENYKCHIALADDLAKSLMEPGSICYGALVDLLSHYQVFDGAGRIEKESMARLLFSKEEVRAQVNAIVHPAVKECVLAQVKEARNQGRLDYFFFEAALLLEDHYEEVCDELWYIYASEDERRMRLKRDRGYTDEKIDQIFASQMPEKAFRQACAHVIDSSGSMEGTQAQVRQILG